MLTISQLQTLPIFVQFYEEVLTPDEAKSKYNMQGIKGKISVPHARKMRANKVEDLCWFTDKHGEQWRTYRHSDGDLYRIRR